MEIMDRDVIEVLKKNMDLAEADLQRAPAAKVDEYLSAFLDAKKDYVSYMDDIGTHL